MNRPGRIEITTKIGCTVDCVYCPQKLLMKNYFADDKSRINMLSLSDFKTCIDKLPEGTRIDFSGMVEPWLNKSCTDMVCYAADKGFSIAVYTTLIGMTDMDFKRICNIKFEEFVLHIPDDKSNTHISVSKEYIDLLQEVIAFKKDDISLVTGYSCHASIHPDIIDAIPPNSKLITELIDRAGNIGSDYVASKKNIGEVVCINCEDDINHNVLLPDGTVVLCCMDYGMQHVLGNLLSQSYEEIQNSIEAAKVRKGLKGEEADVLCRNCTNARTVHELYDDFKIYQDWCNRLLEKDRRSDVDFTKYKQMVANLEKQRLQFEQINLSLEVTNKQMQEELEKIKKSRCYRLYLFFNKNQ